MYLLIVENYFSPAKLKGRYSFSDEVQMFRDVFFFQDKEGLITELRKELRVSDDEHREILTLVNRDDIIQKIRFECFMI